MPDRAPDLTRDMPTHSQMALIYRLSGDFNPLHADPAFARKAGFERPIFHGLGTYGVACHGLMAALCDYAPERVRHIECRFSAPVFPGETISLDIWREAPGEAAFRARVAAREAVVLANGRFLYQP
jgi:acyl dehydratase